MLWQFATSASVINDRSGPWWRRGKLLLWLGSTAVTHQSDRTPGCSLENLVPDTILSPLIPPFGTVSPPPPPPPPPHLLHRVKCRSVSVSMDTGGLLQRLLQSLFFLTRTIVLRDNGSPRPPSCRWISRVTDRCSAKRALKHKHALCAYLFWSFSVFSDDFKMSTLLFAGRQ